MSEMQSNDELAAVEEALAQLTPSTSGVNRDRLMFQAGRRSARRARWSWPLAAAATALVGVILGLQLAPRPDAPDPGAMAARGHAPSDYRPEERDMAASGHGTPVSRPAPTEQERRQARETAAYMRLRDRVLAEGLDALPELAVVLSGPAMRPFSNE